MASGNVRALRMTPTETPSPYTLLSPKKSMPNSPHKSSIKLNAYAHKTTHSSKKYLLNKTSYGTPQEKSELGSYITTPNDTSLSHQKLKKFGSNRKLTNKTKEIFHSTED